MVADDKPQVIALPQFCDPRGNLSFAQDMDQVPFPIRNVAWLYDLPADAPLPPRGYRFRDRFVIPLAGAIDVSVQAPGSAIPEQFHLNRAYRGLFIPRGYIAQITPVTTNTVIVVLSSTIDDPDNPDILTACQ